jgi:predicted DNA-binding transcriptional regulator AlpA
MGNVIQFDHTPPSEGLLDTTRAAQLLGVSASFLNKKRVTGGGPKFCKIGRRVLYRRHDLQTWVDAHRVGSTSEVQAA